MRLLDKYILKAFVGPFLFGVFAFTSIFIGTGTLFRIAQYITEYGAPLLCKHLSWLYQVLLF